MIKGTGRILSKGFLGLGQREGRSWISSSSNRKNVAPEVREQLSPNLAHREH